MKPRNPFNQGLSLIELMVALTLVAILTGLASASFRSQLPIFRLNIAARDLVSDLRWARQLAMAEGRPVSVILDLDSNRYQIERNEQPGHPIGPIRDLGGPAVTPESIDILESTGGRKVTFYPHGTTNVFTTITLANRSGKQKQITVVATGRVRLK